MREERENEEKQCSHKDGEQSSGMLLWSTWCLSLSLCRRCSDCLLAGGVTCVSYRTRVSSGAPVVSRAHTVDRNTMAIVNVMLTPILFVRYGMVQVWSIDRIRVEILTPPFFPFFLFLPVDVGFPVAIGDRFG